MGVQFSVFGPCAEVILESSSSKTKAGIDNHSEGVCSCATDSTDNADDYGEHLNEDERSRAEAVGVNVKTLDAAALAEVRRREGQRPVDINIMVTNLAKKEMIGWNISTVYPWQTVGDLASDERSPGAVLVKAKINDIELALDTRWEELGHWSAVQQGQQIKAEFALLSDYRQFVENTLVEELLALNPGTRRKQVTSKLSFANGMIDSWSLNGIGLIELPPCFTQLRVKKNLDLGHNDLQSLPEGFTACVSGDLILCKNSLRSLPLSFSTVQIGGNLSLGNNELEFLPYNFASTSIGGALGLKCNRLQTLPTNVGEWVVGSFLDLESNQLAQLPESFGGITLGGNLDLSHNRLCQLPRSFGDLVVPGKVDLRCNRITALPPTMGRIKIDGDLDLAGISFEDPESGETKTMDRKNQLDGLNELPPGFGSRIGGSVVGIRSALLLKYRAARRGR